MSNSNDSKPVIGFDDSPMCAYCQKDYHWKLDCPAWQNIKKLEAERKAERAAFDKKMYGRPTGKIYRRGR